MGESVLTLITHHVEGGVFVDDDDLPPGQG